MGLLSRIKDKAEKMIDEKSSFEIKDKISNDKSDKIVIKSSEDIQKEQVQNELETVRNELS